ARPDRLAGRDLRSRLAGDVGGRVRGSQLWRGDRICRGVAKPSELSRPTRGDFSFISTTFGARFLSATRKYPGTGCIRRCWEYRGVESASSPAGWGTLSG